MKRSRKQLKSDIKKERELRHQEYVNGIIRPSEYHYNSEKVGEVGKGGSFNRLAGLKRATRTGNRMFVYETGVNKVRKALKEYKAGGIKYINLCDNQTIEIIHTCYKSRGSALYFFLRDRGFTMTKPRD